MECVSDIACIELLSHIPCEIDLIEPFITVDGERIEIHFALESGETYEFDFTYKVGFPAGDLFGLFFFESLEDVLAVARHGSDPETLEIQTNQPAFTFMPRSPKQDATGILKQEGKVRIVMPILEDLATGGKIFYYGVMAMYQPEQEI